MIRSEIELLNTVQKFPDGEFRLHKYSYRDDRKRRIARKAVLKGYMSVVYRKVDRHYYYTLTDKGILYIRECLKT